MFFRSVKRYATSVTKLTDDVVLSAAMAHIPNSIQSNCQLVQTLQNVGIVKSENVARAMRFVDRKEFLNDSLKNIAYKDGPALAMEGEVLTSVTSQITGIEALSIESNNKVLDIGCGVGYTSSILAQMSFPGITVGVDIYESLIQTAQERSVKSLSSGSNPLNNLFFIVADCFSANPDSKIMKHSPFDKINVGFSVKSKKDLRNILPFTKTGTVIVAPVGDGKFVGGEQTLMKLVRTEISLEEAKKRASEVLLNDDDQQMIDVDDVLWSGEILQKRVFYSQQLTNEDVIFKAKERARQELEDKHAGTAIKNFNVPLGNVKRFLGKGIAHSDIKEAICLREERVRVIFNTWKSKSTSNLLHNVDGSKSEKLEKEEIQRLAKETALLKKLLIRESDGAI